MTNEDFIPIPTESPLLEELARAERELLDEIQRVCGNPMIAADEKLAELLAKAPDTRNV